MRRLSCFIAILLLATLAPAQLARVSSAQGSDSEAAQKLAQRLRNSTALMPEGETSAPGLQNNFFVLLSTYLRC